MGTIGNVTDEEPLVSWLLPDEMGLNAHELPKDHCVQEGRTFFVPETAAVGRDGPWEKHEALAARIDQLAVNARQFSISVG